MIDHSFIFESADSAEKALELIRSQSFDCIVSNFFLPRMNGLEFCVKLRGEGYHTPFILFHVLDEKKVIEKAYTFGVNDYLEKQPSLNNYTVLAQKIKSLVLKDEQRLAES